MLIDILSLFPGYFNGPFNESIIKRAVEKGLIKIHLTDIRTYTHDKHRRVDDRPYGGGPGMLMTPQPVVDAIRAVKTEHAHVVYLSPQGKTLKADKCRELAQKQHLILLCGHYEGIDQRALDLEVDEEISIGDYVLINGCLAAAVLLETVVRFIPGVLGDPLSAVEESFENGLLDCAHYTRPPVFEGLAVPDVLMNGDHKKIEQWRLSQARDKTRHVRPDLLA